MVTCAVDATTPGDQADHDHSNRRTLQRLFSRQASRRPLEQLVPRPAVRPRRRSHSQGRRQARPLPHHRRRRPRRVLAPHSARARRGQRQDHRRQPRTDPANAGPAVRIRLRQRLRPFSIRQWQLRPRPLELADRARRPLGRHGRLRRRSPSLGAGLLCADALPVVPNRAALPRAVLRLAARADACAHPDALRPRLHWPR